MKCKGGCVSLFPSERFNIPPPTNEESLMGLEGAGVGTILRMGGVTPEGDAAKTSEEEIDDLPF